MRPDPDWRFVSRHTLAPGATAVIAALLLAAAAWFQHDQERAFSRFSGDHRAVHEDYEALVYRRRLVDRYHRRYEQLHALGFVGRESRLDWIETLRIATRKLTLPRVSYAIEPQLDVVAPVEAVVAGGDTRIHLSRMSLEIGLLHEVDLLRFIDAFQAQAPGLVTVDGCDIDWVAGGDLPSSQGANLVASCRVRIYSIITSDVAAAETSS